jgi:hypothetical protein
LIIGGWIISTDAETDLVRRDDSASVEKTVAFYRQIPSANVEPDRKPFAAVGEQSMSALIATSIPTARQLSMTNINDLVTATLPPHSSGNSIPGEILR